MGATSAAQIRVTGPSIRTMTTALGRGRPAIERSQLVYDFADGNRDQSDLLGGKGANLAEMTNLGMPVPPGFTISTDACRAYLSEGSLPRAVKVESTLAMREVEEAVGRNFGDPHEPLLVSVRSGAKFSMPGMMETVLNVGLNDASVRGLAAVSGDERRREEAPLPGRFVSGIPGGGSRTGLPGGGWYST